jgi:uncharacterized protein (TIGR02569 family)
MAMDRILLPQQVADAFGVERAAVTLGGTERRTFRSGTTVLRRAAATEGLLWRTHLLHTLPQEGFRIERPLPASDGSWVVDGWTAWTFLDGISATPADATAVARATHALHVALAKAPYAAHLQESAGLADRIAWDDDPLPGVLPPEIDAPVRQLAQLRGPVEGLQKQVIHGDLNYHNILIAPGQEPAFIDFSPYWRPPEFAAAIAAYWLGPHLGETASLRHFTEVRALEQMLIRVAMRQLLGLMEMDDFQWADEFVRAASIVRQLFE